MKILYGVARDGAGDVARSRVLVGHLLARGHHVAVVASAGASSFPELRPDGRFRPDAVISDFDSWSWLYAYDHRLPMLSIDGIETLERADLPDVVRDRRGARIDLRFVRAGARPKLPLCDRYFIPTVFRPRVQAPRTRLFAPVVREEILAAATRRRRGRHLVVVPPSGRRGEVLAALRGIGVECRVHEHGATGSARSFVDDLATCRGVVAGGGLSLAGEAIYLKKPMLALPAPGRPEQAASAHGLALEGFGAFAPRADPRTFRRFVEALPVFEAHLACHVQHGNREILGALDEWLAEAAARRRKKAGADVVDTAA